MIENNCDESHNLTSYEIVIYNKKYIYLAFVPISDRTAKILGIF